MQLRALALLLSCLWIGPAPSAIAADGCQALFSLVSPLPPGLDKAFPQEQSWILREAGYKAEADQIEADLRATLSNGAIKKIEKFKLANSESYLITFESGLIGIFKPQQKRNNWQAEVLAYALDQRLGMNMVPVTVERKIKLGFFRGEANGSLQLFLPGMQPSERVPYRLLSLPRIESVMTAFDFLIGNHDRSGNFFGLNERVVLGDNGDGFMPDTKPFSRKILNELLAQTPSSFRERVLALTVEEFRKILAPLQDAKVIDDAVTRLETLHEILRDTRQSRKNNIRRNVASLKAKTYCGNLFSTEIKHHQRPNRRVPTHP